MGYFDEIISKVKINDLLLKDLFFVQQESDGMYSHNIDYPSDIDLINLCNAMAFNYSVTNLTIFLSKTKIDDSDIKLEIFNAIARMLCVNKVLLNFTIYVDCNLLLDCVTVFFNALASNSGIRHLVIQDTTGNLINLPCIKRALIKNTNIEFLNVSYSKVDQTLIMELETLVCSINQQRFEVIQAWTMLRAPLLPQKSQSICFLFNQKHRPEVYLCEHPTEIIAGFLGVPKSIWLKLYY